MNRKIFLLLLMIFLILPICQAFDFNHSYPRLAFFNFGHAPAEWYAQFDLVHTYGTARLEKIRELNPRTALFVSRDWNVWHMTDDPAPDEWYLKDPDGNKVETGYGNMLDLSDFCEEPTRGKFTGQKYNEYIAQDTIQRLRDGDLVDGFICQGAWDHPFGINPVDVDRNGVNDHDEHIPLDAVGYVAKMLWFKNHFRAGIAKAARPILEEAQKNGQAFLINSGIFHDHNWENSNGLMIEKGRSPTSVRWMYGYRYKPWMETAPEPHIFWADMRAESKNDFKDMRYLFGYMMLGDGYMSFTEHRAGEHHYNKYYDEFDLDFGWPKGPPQGLFCKGDYDCVWVRFFDHGAFIMNPLGENKTITDDDIKDLPGYGGPYHRFQGGQDPAHNNGELFDSITLWGKPHPDFNWAYGDSILLVDTPQIVIADIIIDNGEAETSPASELAELNGDWEKTCDADSTWSFNCKPYDWFMLKQFPVAFSKSSSDQAIYRPTIGFAGEYEVFEWHGDLDDKQEASNVAYELKHAGGIETGTIDQSKDYGKWNSLGAFTFNEGTDGYVKLKAAGADGTVQADGMKFVYQDETAGENGGDNFNVADLNKDRVVDIFDLVLLVRAFGTYEYDLTGDGTVDVQDLLVIIQKL